MPRQYRFSWIVISIFVCSLLFITRTAQTATAPADLKIILQTQAGLAAYSQITGTISTSYVKPLYLKVDQQTDEYILGDYQLSGRSAGDSVKLVVHRDGWALAYHPSSVNVSQLFDCYSYPYKTIPAFMPNRLDTAINQVAVALDVTDTVKSYYDFRHPGASHIVLAWLLQLNSGDLSSTITPHLSGSYYERGFGFCTVTYYSKLYLNSVLLAQGDLKFIFGSLDATQLKPGMANVLVVSQPPVFWFNQGFMGGVGIVYDGPDVQVSNGYRRDFALSYPAMLGEPLDISSLYLPIAFRTSSVNEAGHP